MAKVGRPSSYTKEVGDQICSLLADGQSARSICRQLGMPNWSTLWRWSRDIEEFRSQYAEARQLCLEAWAQDIVIISEDQSRDLQPDGKGGFKSDNTAVNRDRLRVDTRKWILSKLLPKQYGEKTVTEITGKDGGPIQTQAVDAPPQETRDEWLERRAKENAERIH